MGILQGKVAVVTGGAGGIGSGVTRKLAAEGAKVVVGYSGDAGPAERLAKEVGAKAVRADVTRRADLEALVGTAVEAFGRLDILVSAAGVEHFGPFGEVTEEAFDQAFAVNCRGQFFAVQAAARAMKEGGRVVCFSSISATEGFHEHAVYGGSKAAVEGFVRNLAIDLGRRGITINAVAPGPVQSPMFDQFAERYRDPDSKLPVVDQMKRFSPLGRVGTAGDVANVIAFLASEEGGWLTGQVIRVSGGG